MASKRSRPYDDPPSPDSSAEEEEEEFEEEEEEEQQQQTPVRNPPKLQQQAAAVEEEDPEEEEEEFEEEEVEEEEEEEFEEEEEEEEDDGNNLKTPPPSVKGPADTGKKIAEPEPESDSGTESDPDSPPSPNAAAFVAKPIVKESPVPKPKSAAKAVALNVKEKPAKAAKPQAKQQGGESDGAEKKAPGSGFSRVWSLEDEIAVLHAMIDYKKVNNKDPGSNHDEFYSFVIGKLSNGKLNKTQVYDKVRRLRSKYKKNVGKDREISNPHERKMFQLSSKIWGEISNNIVGNNSNSNDGNKVCVAIAALPVQSYGNAANSNGGGHEKGGGSGRSAKKMRTLEKVARSEGDMMEVDTGRKGVAELYPNLMKAFGVESGPRASLSGDSKSYLSMVVSSKLEEWDRKWKEVDVAEMDAFLRRSALVQEVGKELLNTMKSN